MLTGEGAIHNLDRGYMYESIGIINPDGTERALVPSDNYTVRVGYTIGSRIIYRIINGNVTYYWTPNKDYGGKQLEPYFTDCCMYGQIGLFSVDYWSSSLLYANVSFANTESILIYSIEDKTLSVREINMEDGTFDTNVLIENCIVEKNSTNVKTVTPKEDITWRIYAEDNEGVVSIKYAKKSEYIGPASKVVILQPF